MSMTVLNSNTLNFEQDLVLRDLLQVLTDQAWALLNQHEFAFKQFGTQVDVPFFAEHYTCKGVDGDVSERCREFSESFDIPYRRLTVPLALNAKVHPSVNADCKRMADNLGHLLFKMDYFIVSRMSAVPIWPQPKPGTRAAAAYHVGASPDHRYSLEELVEKVQRRVSRPVWQVPVSNLQLVPLSWHNRGIGPCLEVAMTINSPGAIAV